MSRTYNTAPLELQARHIPLVFRVERHSLGCERGQAPCSLSDPRPLSHRGDARGRGRWEHCYLTVAYYGPSPVGGSRADQSSWADLVEGGVRSRTRDALRGATKTANAALHSGWDHEVLEDLPELVVEPGYRSIDWELW